MVYEKLTLIQNKIKVSKSKYNKFGNFYYRSIEDIQGALKPLLEKYKCCLYIRDEIEVINGRNYVKAIARLVDIEDNSYVEVSAYACEAGEKKGMDVSQVTGSTSSYARKYALGGLLLLDDIGDADSMDNSNLGETKQGLSVQKNVKIVLKEGSDAYERVVKALQNGYTIEDVKKKYTLSRDIEKKLLSMVSEK
jgi:hypothetical protein